VLEQNAMNAQPRLTMKFTNQRGSLHLPTTSKNKKNNEKLKDNEDGEKQRRSTEEEEKKQQNKYDKPMKDI